MSTKVGSDPVLSAPFGQRRYQWAGMIAAWTWHSRSQCCCGILPGPAKSCNNETSCENSLSLTGQKQWIRHTERRSLGVPFSFDPIPMACVEARWGEIYLAFPAVAVAQGDGHAPHTAKRIFSSAGCEGTGCQVVSVALHGPYWYTCGATSSGNHR
eukprot:244132-Chlamydomonas_euryale.AAC.22